MSLENKGQFNVAANAMLERTVDTKEGKKIDSALYKKAIDTMVTVTQNATKPGKHDTELMKKAKEQLAHDPSYQAEVFNFMCNAAFSRGSYGTEEFNANKFDKNGEKGLSAWEVEQRGKEMNLGLTKIMEQGNVGNFKLVETDIKSDIEDSPYNPMKYIGDFKLGEVIAQVITGAKGGSEEAHHYMEAKWDDGAAHFAQGLIYSSLREGGNIAQSVVMIFADILAIGASGGGLLAQYGYYRTRFYAADKNSPNEAEYKAKMDAIAQQHPAIGVLHLVTTVEGWGKAKALFMDLVNFAELTAEKVVAKISLLLSLVGGGGFLLTKMGGTFAKISTKFPQLAKLEKVGEAMKVAGEKVDKFAEKVEHYTDAIGSRGSELVNKAADAVVGGAEKVARKTGVMQEEKHLQHAHIRSSVSSNEHTLADMSENEKRAAGFSAAGAH